MVDLSDYVYGLVDNLFFKIHLPIFTISSFDTKESTLKENIKAVDDFYYKLYPELKNSIKLVEELKCNICGLYKDSLCKMHLAIFTWINISNTEIFLCL